MNAPKYIIQPNAGDVHHTNPGWLVLFISFQNPASIYFDPKTPLMAVKDIKTTIVENDCINITINSPKASFAKTCQLTLKVTDTVWQHTIAPGDWVFVWISTDKNHIDNLGNILRNEPPSRFGNRLCNWNSGLKFVGRVIGVNLNYTTTPSGIKSVVQTVSCQAFLEFATSVYYTYVGFGAPNPSKETPSGQVRNIDVGEDDTATKQAIFQGAAIEKLKLFNQRGRLQRFYANFAEKFLNIIKNSPVLSPDTMIQNLLIILWGVTRNNQTASDLRQGARGSAAGPTRVQNIGQFSDAIQIPAIVGYILGRPRATLLYEIYNVLLGVQTYRASAQAPWQAFFPNVEDLSTATAANVFWRTPGPNSRCKGVCPFTAPMWSNETIWAILSQFLNPVVNEMYTALRVDYFNRISPTLVVREQPFSTGLQAVFRSQVKTLAPPVILDVKKNITNKLGNLKPSQNPNRPNDTEKRWLLNNPNIAQSPNLVTYFANVPRWVLTPNMVRSVSVGTNEANRINLVQVWGQSSFIDFTNLKLTPQELREQQALQGNAIIDEEDIKRHGLRADIQSSQFDFFFKGTDGKPTFFAPIWAAMRADWLFHGHLKLSGSITTTGIVEPICEGDNLEFDGVVYHIEGVNHQAGIDASGVKFFNTALTLSNGISAQRLHKTLPPSYITDRPAERESADLPGMTLLQNIPGATYKNEDSEP